MLHKYPFSHSLPVNVTLPMAHCSFPVWLDWRPCPELPLLGRSPRASVSRWVNVEANMDPGKRPRDCGARKSSSRCVSGWVNVELNLEPGKCPCGFGARRPRPELPLLGRSPRASVNVESNLEPRKCPRGCSARRPHPELPLLARRM